MGLFATSSPVPVRPNAGRSFSCGWITPRLKGRQALSVATTRTFVRGLVVDSGLGKLLRRARPALVMLAPAILLSPPPDIGDEARALLMARPADAVDRTCRAGIGAGLGAIFRGAGLGDGDRDSVMDGESASDGSLCCTGSPRVEEYWKRAFLRRSSRLEGPRIACQGRDDRGSLEH